jgi:hypothetical protein
MSSALELSPAFIESKMILVIHTEQKSSNFHASTVLIRPAAIMGIKFIEMCK